MLFVSEWLIITPLFPVTAGQGIFWELFKFWTIRSNDAWRRDFPLTLHSLRSNCPWASTSLTCELKIRRGPQWDFKSIILPELNALPLDAILFLSCDEPDTAMQSLFMSLCSLTYAFVLAIPHPRETRTPFLILNFRGVLSSLGRSRSPGHFSFLCPIRAFIWCLHYFLASAIDFPGS